ncbi:MAG: hypothetical protein JF619_23035 [Massilia sp.]|nr:hypothetical protein [Massilia sp.]
MDATVARRGQRPVPAAWPDWPDGCLYVTFSRAATWEGNNDGPGGLVDGEVWKINVLSGRDRDRIDNAQHQYGASSVITGDPKVFGTVYIGARGLVAGRSMN